MQPVLLALLVIAVGAFLFVLVREVWLATGKQGAEVNDSLYDEQSSGAAPRTVTWKGTWNPHQARRRGHSDDTVTYQARVGIRGGESSPWDPYAKEQSRVHRIREARHRPRSSSQPDYYQMLGLQRDATDAQITAAYKRYAAEIHPDKFFDDPVKRAQAEEKLKDLNRMMEVLRNPTKRAQYDARL